MCAMKLHDADNEDSGKKEFQLDHPQKVRVWLDNVNEGDDAKAHLTDADGKIVWDPEYVGPVKVKCKVVGSTKRCYATFKSTPKKKGTASKDLETHAHKHQHDPGDLTIEITNDTTGENDMDHYPVNYTV